MSDQDGISANMLKNTAVSRAHQLSKLFNVSLTTGVIPPLSVEKTSNNIVPSPILQNTDPLLYWQFIYRLNVVSNNENLMMGADRNIGSLKFKINDEIVGAVHGSIMQRQWIPHGDST